MLHIHDFTGVWSPFAMISLEHADPKCERWTECYPAEHVDAQQISIQIRVNSGPVEPVQVGQAAC
jgi:hypothetical protein